MSEYSQSKCRHCSEKDTQPCAKVQTSSLVVPLGSPVSASCVIGDSCPLVLQQDDAIEWQLDQYTLPSSPSTGEGGRVSKVFIPSFNLSRAFLICSIQGHVVGGVEIRAGCKTLLLLLFTDLFLQMVLQQILIPDKNPPWKSMINRDLLL